MRDLRTSGPLSVSDRNGRLSTDRAVSIRRTCLKSSLWQKIVRSPSRLSFRQAGFTLIELVAALAIGTVLTAVAIPVFSRAMANMKINSAVSDFSGAIASSRYRAIKDNQVYTFVLTVPPNTYVLTNSGTGAAGTPIPMPSSVSINGGTSATYTYTLCPNGMVYGAGGCNANANLPPALSFVYQGRQINVAISEVGNVKTTIIH